MDDVPARRWVTDATFEQYVVRSPIPVVVDFTAAWCAPCRGLRPVLAELSEKLAGRVAFVTADVDDAVGVTRSYGIQALPTYLFLENGREKGRAVGPLDPIALRGNLRRHFASSPR
jgi:thioredoxin 1